MSQTVEFSINHTDLSQTNVHVLVLFLPFSVLAVANRLALIKKSIRVPHSFIIAILFGCAGER
jgi:hypothetical protein